MLVRSVMSKNVITVSPDTSVGEAQKIMKEHGFRRLPVVDNGKLIGLVTQSRLETVQPKTSTTPLLWQITYLISHTTVKDVMRKKVYIVKPGDSVEYAVAKAQAHKVGTLVVVDKDKVVGICTTNDFFYAIVNPTLGIGVPGIRLIIDGAGEGKHAEKVIGLANRLGFDIKCIWSSVSSTAPEIDLTLQLDTSDITPFTRELDAMGYKYYIRQQYKPSAEQT